MCYQTFGWVFHWQQHPNPHHHRPKSANSFIGLDSPTQNRKSVILLERKSQAKVWEPQRFKKKLEILCPFTPHTTWPNSTSHKALAAPRASFTLSKGYPTPPTFLTII
eukprot:c26961_g1_i3 orf=399-722(+)